MDQPKIWKARRDREFANPASKYTPFEIAYTHLGHLKLVGFKVSVEKIVREMLERELKPLVERFIKKIETYPRIVCWTCKNRGHYSRDCKFNKRNSTN